MCRGVNGGHEQLCLGVSYCERSETLHINLVVAADEVGGMASDASVRPLWVVGKVLSWVARYSPLTVVRKIVLAGPGIVGKGVRCGTRS